MNNDIIDKIQKLLARADEDRNDNAHEREIALRQAHRMLSKAGLTMSDVMCKDERTAKLGGMVKHAYTVSRSMWEKYLYSSVADMFGAVVLSTRGKGKITIIGRESNVATTAHMAKYLVKSIRREAKQIGAKINDFGQGAQLGVADQIDRIINEIPQDYSDGKGLMVLKNQLVSLDEARKLASDDHPDIKERVQKIPGINADVANGYIYGQSVSLNQQLDDKTQE